MRNSYKLLKLHAFVFCFFSIAVQSKTLERTIAVVGNQPILQSEVNRLLSELKTSRALANILQFSKKQITFNKVLDYLIEGKVIRLKLEEIDAAAKDSDVNQQIASIAKQNNNMSIAQLKASLAQEKISFETYKNNIRAQIEKRNLYDRELRNNSNGISEQEIKKYYEKNLETESLLYLVAQKNTKGNRSKLTRLAKKINQSSGPSDLNKKIKASGANELGWTTSSSLNLTFRRAIAKAKKSDKAIGPFLWKNQLNLLVAEKERKGSPDGYKQKKAAIRQAIQTSQVERQLKIWLNQKKEDLNIVVNR